MAARRTAGCPRMTQASAAPGPPGHKCRYPSSSSPGQAASPGTLHPRLPERGPLPPHTRGRGHEDRGGAPRPPTLTYLPPRRAPLGPEAPGAGCGNRCAPPRPRTAGARVGPRRGPACARPQRPYLRERGQGLGVCEQRQRRRRRRGRGRGRGRDPLPGPSSPVEVQLEGVVRPRQTGTTARQGPQPPLPGEEEQCAGRGGTWSLARPSPWGWCRATPLWRHGTVASTPASRAADAVGRRHL